MDIISWITNNKKYGTNNRNNNMGIELGDERNTHMYNIIIVWRLLCSLRKTSFSIGEKGRPGGLKILRGLFLLLRFFVERRNC